MTRKQIEADYIVDDYSVATVVAGTTRYIYYLKGDFEPIHYRLSPSGSIFEGPNHLQNPSDSWRAIALRHVVKTTWKLSIAYIMESSDGWEIYHRHAFFKNGHSQWRLIDLDHGTYRLWNQRVTLHRVQVTESKDGRNSSVENYSGTP